MARAVLFVRTCHSVRCKGWEIPRQNPHCQAGFILGFSYCSQVVHKARPESCPQGYPHVS